jgi:transcription-repair coupling factor (superfamily II helicase)
MGGIMTAPGPECVVTPIAGLVELALRAPTLQRLVDLAADRPDELTLVGPASARLFVASARARCSW